MSKESDYAAQLRALGVYDPAFDPAIKELAQLERELRRVRTAWKRTVPDGCHPSVLDPHYPVIVQLQKDIMSYRDALGLTPKALHRLLRSNAAEGGPVSTKEGIAERLDAIFDKVSAYE